MDYGFPGLAERSQPQWPGDPKHRGTAHFPRSYSVEFYGKRPPDCIAAVSHAFDQADRLDVLISRRWATLRHTPFLHSKQPQSFQDNDAWLRQRVDSGEPACSNALGQ